MPTTEPAGRAMEPLRRCDVFIPRSTLFFVPRPIPPRSHGRTACLGGPYIHQSAGRGYNLPPIHPPLSLVSLCPASPSLRGRSSVVQTTHLYLATSQPYPPSRQLAWTPTRPRDYLAHRSDLCPPTTMLAASSVPTTTSSLQQQHVGESDPFVLYARSLHDYTLRLWTESRRIAEEKARIKAAAAAANGRNLVEPPPQTPKRTVDEKVKA
ncbi:hypothetical protein L227DRAFT_650127 [Lentinus tigrinus ALCF2SS1-6]|uniref:Uncharacterized protein n=1 Tax=Lentinus tigrinus ALCF2SS1-6 TaxID=1328759 RepID=A0A5C2SNX3_9APHY|nr:hypothetical protein L227DRAFT_650127 [Lentinus tigrinus ALCF2SS1-6]